MNFLKVAIVLISFMCNTAYAKDYIIGVAPDYLKNDNFTKIMGSISNFVITNLQPDDKIMIINTVDNSTIID